MKKRLSLLSVACLLAMQMQAQLSDGIVAPNFTATDINGNTWTLYDLLDQGKSAVLFFGATWDYDSWQYHQSGRLNLVWEQYGPDGTNEIIPFFIETDDNNTPEDLNGTGGSTYGDWVTGTPYPIIDGGGSIADQYAQDGVPRVYAICPNRILANAEDFATVQFLLLHDDCLLPAGVNNAGMLRYVAPPKEFCGEVSFSPNVRFQNLGTAQMTSLSLDLLLNGSLVETKLWTGSIALYQTAGIVFSPVTITETTTVEVVIGAVNGQVDDDPANNLLPAQVLEGPSIGTNFLVVEIKTDDYPREIYWEVVDDEGTVFSSGGNPGVFVGQEWEGAYTQGSTVYQQQVALPADGCYALVMYDSAEDGVCCGGGLGYYRLQDENNFIYLQGGLYKDKEERPFALAGAATINDNALVRGYLGLSGDFCGEPTFVPSVAVQNIGANTANSLKINVLNNTDLVQTFDWNGTLTPGQLDTITLNPVTVDTTAKLFFEIVEVNQQPDTFLFQNEIKVDVKRRLPKAPGLVLEFVTDEWGYENYWQITNSAGDLIASGGNQIIGPNGGGLRVATADDPNVYPQFSMITEQISLPDNLNDCYTFLFVDDWGDGINQPGHIKLKDNLDNLLFDFRPLTTGDIYLIDGQFGPSATTEPSSEDWVSLSPNPATDHLDLAFSFQQNSGNIQLQIVGVAGNVLRQTSLPAGTQRHSLDLTGMANGIYFLKIMDENGGEMVRRFVVAGR